MMRDHSSTPHGVDDYRSYVEHPRFGRGPRFSGLNPDVRRPFDVHWHSDEKVRIPNTAIEADGSKQRWAAGENSYGHGTVIRYYFDLRRVCRDCGRPFISFAEEQQHWYEVLGFPLEVDCVRCHECRRAQRGLEAAHKRYQELVVLPEPTPSEVVELTTLSLELIDGGAFSPHPRTFSRIRMWLNRLANSGTHETQRVELVRRLEALEKA